MRVSEGDGVGSRGRRGWANGATAKQDATRRSKTQQDAARAGVLCARAQHAVCACTFLHKPAQMQIESVSFHGPARAQHAVCAVCWHAVYAHVRLWEEGSGGPGQQGTTQQ